MATIRPAVTVAVALDEASVAAARARAMFTPDLDLASADLDRRSHDLIAGSVDVVGARGAFALGLLAGVALCLAPLAVLMALGW